VKTTPPGGLTWREERLIDARYTLAERCWGRKDLAWNHSVFCSVFLPRRNPGDSTRVWTRECGGVSLRVEAGATQVADGSWVDVGLPYGPRARLVLIHLFGEAIKHQSPIVEVDTSFTSFARSLGLSTTGRNLRTLRDQTIRLSTMGMRIGKHYGTHADQFRGPVFDSFRVEFPRAPGQLGLWSSVVQFSPKFYDSLKDSAVPVRHTALQALKHSSRCLDLYLWSSYRAWRLKRPLVLSWRHLRQQFGVETQNLPSFRRRFTQAFKQVATVYPELNFTLDKKALTLMPSRPPVPRAARRIGGASS
jgi:hypothetical protein